MKSAGKGEVLVIISTLAFGAMGVLARGVYAYDYPLLSTLAFRFIIASLSMGIYLKIRGYNFAVTKEQFKFLILLGIGGYSLFSILYFAGVKYTGASVTALVFAGFPVFVALISRFFFHQPIGKKKAFFLFTSLVALVLLTGGGSHSVNLFGVFLSLAAGFFYGIYTVLLNHPKVKEIPPVTASFHIIFLTACTVFVISLFKGEFIFPPNISVLWRVVVLGVLSTSVAILTYYLGVQYLGAVKASIISNFEAVVSTFLAVTFLGERLSAGQWFGAALMILSIFGVTLIKE